jgi:hypothetical protein
MAKSDKFLQFPLCALAFGQDLFTRLHHIISYGVVTAGAEMFKKLDKDILEEKADRIANEPKTPDDYDLKNYWHVAVMIGAHDLGVDILSLERTLKNYQTLDAFVKAFEKKHPGHVLVRFKEHWAFEVRDNNMLTAREFGILCGMYSVLGDKDFARITRDRLIRRALGYKDEAVFKAERWNRDDHEVPMQLWELQRSLDKLDERKFFARARPNRRQTFYALSLSKEQLMERLVVHKTRRAEFHAERQASNESLQQLIRAKMLALEKAKPRIKVNKPPKARIPASNSAQITVTASSHAASLDVHFNRTSLNRNSLDKNSPDTAPTSSGACALEKIEAETD